MAQADSVPSSSRQLITGESANQSRNLRAVNLPAVRGQPVDRRDFIGGSDAPGIIKTKQAPLLLRWRQKGPPISMGGPSHCCRYRAPTGPEPPSPDTPA